MISAGVVITNANIVLTLFSIIAVFTLTDICVKVAGTVATAVSLSLSILAGFNITCGANVSNIADTDRVSRIAITIATASVVIASSGNEE